MFAAQTKETRCATLQNTTCRAICEARPREVSKDGVYHSFRVVAVTTVDSPYECDTGTTVSSWSFLT